MKKTIEERKKYAKIFAQAWVDEEFKKRLLEDPATVLKENGIEVPEGVNVKFIDAKENEKWIQLPPKPAELGDLSAEDLERISGGGRRHHSRSTPDSMTH